MGVKVITGKSEFKFGACSEGELNALIERSFEGQARNSVLVLAIYTNMVEGATVEEIAKQLASEEPLAHLLELRAFTKESELHLMRSSMEEPFAWRFVRDGCGKSIEHFDEEQFLDIDEGRTKEDSDSYTYHSINGGTYRLPRANAERIRVRNYLAYDEDNIASVVDFRIVDILCKE